MAEGGQSSTGSALRFLADKLFQGGMSMRDLDAQASEVPIGSDGLRVTETFQGSRTPICDPSARGAFNGLSLAHSPATLWRSLIEAIAVGTRDNLDALAAETGGIREVQFCGGATRSPFYLQQHADAANTTILVREKTASNAPAVGAGLLAAAALQRGDRRAALKTTSRLWGLLSSRNGKLIRPHPKAASEYAATYLRRPVLHDEAGTHVVAASILAADVGSLGADAVAAFSAGARWIHVDVCDGSDLAQNALTFGPATVAALDAALEDDECHLDVHLAVFEPERYVDKLIEAGATRITIQVEPFLSDLDRLAGLVRRIAEQCSVGLALAPATPLDALVMPLLELPIDLVDVLAVDPGVGGQTFQASVLTKLSTLRDLYPHIPYRQIDGGINAATKDAALAAGANVLTAGTAVFPSSPSPRRLRDHHIALNVAGLCTVSGPKGFLGRFRGR